jgi:integrase
MMPARNRVTPTGDIEAILLRGAWTGNRGILHSGHEIARAALDRAVKAAKLAAPKPTLHDLRHSHVSMLFALDHNLVAIQRRVGHKKPDTTLRIYAHEWRYREAQRSQIGSQLDQLFQTDEQQLQQQAASARKTAP